MADSLPLSMEKEFKSVPGGSRDNLMTISVGRSSRSIDILPRIEYNQQSSSAPTLPRFRMEKLPQLLFAAGGNAAHDQIPAAAAPLTYVVGENDTLQSIALRFDLSVDWLSRQNRLAAADVFPGDVLIVSPPQPEELQPDPIQCAQLSIDFSSPSVPGKLYLLDTTLIFQPDSLSARPLRIDLLGHLESVLLPHPQVMSDDSPDLTHPNTPMIYMISYLEDPADEATMSATYFAVTLTQSTKLKMLVEQTALKAQKVKGYTAPKPEEIPVKKEDPIQSSPPFWSMIRLPTMNAAPAPPLEETVRRRRRTLSVLPRVQLIQGSSEILNDREVDELRATFPFRFKNSDWSLLYKLSRDGASYTSFFNCTEKASPVVLLIRSDSDEKIGAFISCGLKFSRRYYGNGDIFVFRFTPKCEVFKWENGLNQYFVTSSQAEIAIGGGGSSAIWIDGNLLNAISEPCPTFSSPGLTGNVNFKCNEIEVWRIGGNKYYS